MGDRYYIHWLTEQRSSCPHTPPVSAQILYISTITSPAIACPHRLEVASHTDLAHNSCSASGTRRAGARGQGPGHSSSHRQSRAHQHRCGDACRPSSIRVHGAIAIAIATRRACTGPATPICVPAGPCSWTTLTQSLSFASVSHAPSRMLRLTCSVSHAPCEEGAATAGFDDFGGEKTGRT